MSDTSKKKDRTEEVYNKIAEIRQKKVKAQITLHLDGSGAIARAEIKYDI